MSEHSVEKLMWVAERLDAYIAAVIAGTEVAGIDGRLLEWIKAGIREFCRSSLEGIYEDVELRKFYEGALSSPEKTKSLAKIAKLMLELEGG